MRTKSTLNLFMTTLGQILLFIVSINLLNLIFELMHVKDFENFDIVFDHGYFILNGEKIGYNIFANLFTLIILAFIITFLRSRKQAD